MYESLLDIVHVRYDSTQLVSGSVICGLLLLGEMVLSPKKNVHRLSLGLATVYAALGGISKGGSHAPKSMDTRYRPWLSLSTDL
jgi:hypothetical protein